MTNPFTKEELFDSLPVLLNRLSPFIITEIDNSANLSLFQQTLKQLEPYEILEHFENPKKLFEFIKDHQSKLIILKDDIFSKRKDYRNIVQGAVCSSPDSSELWSVNYLDEKSFVFKGRIILCTKRTKENIKSKKKFEYFSRDCHFI
jgi:hypothetical protein